MSRIVPALVAASLAAASAAVAQNTTTLDSSGNASIAGPATVKPGMGQTGAGMTMSGPPVVGGATVGIAPMGTPPTIGGTSMGDSSTPGATPAMTGNKRQTGASTAASSLSGLNQAPIPGANSFTAGQARARIQHGGFTEVTGLHKDRQGIWRGKAMKDGQTVNVALDYQGKVVGQ